jgi:hypothetical protein
VCFWFVLSKNENNNGFDSIGLNFFSFDCRRAVYLPFCCCTLHCFPWLLVLDWMRYLCIERHLAEKLGTFSAFLNREVVFTMDERYLEVVVFSL